MDDDIRNRFRSTRRNYDVPSPKRRPTPLPRQPEPPAQKQTNSSSWFDDQEDIIEPVKTEPKPRKYKRRRTKRFSFKKILVLLLLLSLIGGIGFFGYIKFIRDKLNKPAQVSTQEQKAVETPKPTGTIRMIATGENFAFESINNAAKTDSGIDYLPMMVGFKPFFDKSDIRLCNETTIGGGVDLGVSGFPSFNSPVEWSSGFASLGCNVMNLGSDHTNDKGQAGIDAMVSTWESQSGVLAFAGANKSIEQQSTIKYFTVKEVKFAYLSYTTRIIKTDHTPYGINLYNTDTAKQQVEEARKNAALVIVSMTWGNEDQASITGDQERIAQELADSNVDVIIGGGSHVIQPAKILSGKEGHQTLVWFSLGNFLNSQLPLDNLIGGMAVMDFDVATTTLRDPKLLPVYMHYEWTPAQKAAGNVGSRRNFKLFPLDLAGDALAVSQNGTTVDAQTARVTGIITQFAPIKVITSTEF